MIASLLIPWALKAEHEAFAKGLKAAGYAVTGSTPKNADLTVVWNGSSSRGLKIAGTVLVAENGYLGRGYCALAVGGHNGAGTWPAGGPERFRALGLALRPWRVTGEHVLVCGSRGLGLDRQPDGWVERTVEILRRHTDRPIQVRPHPGNWKRLPEHPDVSLARDLSGAWACVIWASTAGVKALLAGIPVIRCAPHWIAAGAAGNRLEAIESPPMPDRLPVFERLAWAQWTLDELASGEPFRLMLQKAAA